MNEDIMTVLIVTMVSVGCFVGFQLLVNFYSTKLTESISNNPEKFKKMIDSRIVKILFDNFTREYMQLNYLIAHGTKIEVRDHIFKIDRLKLSNNQRNSLYRSALQYYISINDEKDALKIQKRYNEFVDKNNLNPEMKNEFEMEMKMYFHKSISTLKYINEKIELCKESNKHIWYLKKAYILKENNRLKEAKECMHSAIESTSDKKKKEELIKILNNDLKDL